MRTKAACLAVASVFALGSTAYALYLVTNEGTWPKDWPAELDPLRKQARTLVGPEVHYQHYAIHFTSREEFEAAWPHLLEVQTPGASVVLVRGPNFFLGKENIAGVVVHSPPAGQVGSNSIELVVDGDIVDLNRIPLPADCPIIDKRFQDAKDE